MNIICEIGDMMKEEGILFMMGEKGSFLYTKIAINKEKWRKSANSERMR